MSAPRIAIGGTGIVGGGVDSAELSAISGQVSVIAQQPRVPWTATNSNALVYRDSSAGEAGLTRYHFDLLDGGTPSVDPFDDAGPDHWACDIDILEVWHDPSVAAYYKRGIDGTPVRIAGGSTKRLDSGATLAQARAGFRNSSAGWVDVAAVGVGASSSSRSVLLTDFGADGTPAGDIAAMDNALQAAKGGAATLIIPDGTWYHGGHVMEGSEWNGTRIHCDGVLKLAPDASLSGRATLFTKKIGLAFRNCTDIHLNYRGDGNRAQQVSAEPHALVGLAGVRRFTSEYIEGKEFTSDVLVLLLRDGNDLTGNTATESDRRTLLDSQNCADVTIGRLSGWQSSVAGRNTLTVNSCEGLSIRHFRAHLDGGTIGSTGMPGGLDIEPNAATGQSYSHSMVSDVQVGSAHIVTAGHGGFAINGKPDPDGRACVRGVTCPDVKIRSVSEQLATNSVFVRYAETVRLPACTLKNDYSSRSLPAPMINQAGVWVGSCKDVEISAVAHGYGRGLYIGQATNPVSDTHVHIEAYDVHDVGVFAGALTDVRLTGEVHSFSPSSTAVGNKFSVRVHGLNGTATQTRARYEINARGGLPNQSRSYRRDLGASTLVTMVDCEVAECDVSGWSDRLQAFDQFSTDIRKHRVRGLTDSPVKPSRGEWRAGDSVERRPIPTSDLQSPSCVVGWIRATDGAGHVLGTDWIEQTLST